jgi:methylthioribose-1-phosphate isomerase
MTHLERLEAHTYPDVDDSRPTARELAEAIKWAIARIRQLERVEVAARVVVDHAQHMFSSAYLQWHDVADLNDALSAPLPPSSASQSKATEAV